MTEKDAAQERDGGNTAAAGAATMMRAAFMLPLGAMKAACDMQKQMLEMMESLVPGAAADREPGPAAGARPPATGASVSASAGGWGPVTAQDPVTGWGPMPRQ